MKGISEIIATILMLMITLGISGTAYLFIAGTLTQQTQGLEILDTYCIQGTKDNSSITLRNLGSDIVTTANIKINQFLPVTTTDLRWDLETVSSGGTVTAYDECEGEGVRICSYRVVPPVGRPLNVPVSCS